MTCNIINVLEKTEEPKTWNFYWQGETKLIFWSTGKTAKKIGRSVGKMKITLFDSYGYVTCKFSTWVEIHPRLNSTLPIVKALFVVTC